MTNLYGQYCSEDCERMPTCRRCGRRKAPIGRDIASAAAGSYCDRDCKGYRQALQPGHLWPGELADLRAGWTPGGESQ